MNSICVVQTEVFFKYQRLSRAVLVTLALMVAFMSAVGGVRELGNGNTELALKEFAMMASVLIVGGISVVVVAIWGHRQGVWVDFGSEQIWFSYGLRAGMPIPFDALEGTTLMPAPLGIKLKASPEFVKKYKYRTGSTAVSIPGFMSFGRVADYNQLEMDLPEPFESLDTPLVVLDPITWKRALAFAYLRGNSAVIDGRAKKS